jgi:copper chaperone
MSTLKLDVSNMTCGGCARSVEKIIQKQDSTSKVTVDLASGRVEAQTSADAGAIAAALTAAGFPAKQAA